MNSFCDQENIVWNKNFNNDPKKLFFDSDL